MALARVVEFEGVDRARLDEMRRQVESGEGRPEGLPASELIVLHDGGDRSLVIVMFDSEDDYRKGDEVLSAMPAEDTPGRRTSVQRYDVVVRMMNREPVTAA